MRLRNTFKQGATSIYVVVIATLLFSVITFSFIRIIINEAAKTTSDELAQAAYDSALAGVEDAKTALKRYYECLGTSGENRPEGCGDDNSGIIGYIKKGFDNPSDCDAVSWALGRFSTSATEDDGIREVLIQEQTKTGGDRQNIVQAYTCVVIDNTLDDYRSTLSSSTPIRVIPLKTEDANSVTGLVIRWYTEDDGSLESLNYASADWYYPAGGSDNSKPLPTPPTLSATVIQTGDEFKLEEFNNSSSDTTNRGTVILTPTQNGSTTHLGANVLVDSNNHNYNNRSNHNSPQKIKCQAGLSDEFACVVSIELPKPIGGTRRKSDDNEGTFYLILSLPYGNPTTTFSVQLCNDNETGGTRGDCKLGDNSPSIAQFKDVQIAVDSTGRANDMYSRVEARVELSDVFFPFPEFAISASGSGDDSIKKNFYITSQCIDSTDPANIADCSNTNE